ncbi:MAG: CDP-glycerol glycerophosphotransferase family protein [Oscillospiraceae bacterium]
MKTIYMYALSIRNLEKLLPICKVLSKYRNIDVKVLAAPFQTELLLRNNISYIDLAKFSTIKMSETSEWTLALTPILDLLAQKPCDLFFTTEEAYIGRNILLYCKEQGISTIVYQSVNFVDMEQYFFTPFEGDAFFTWGEQGKAKLVSWGCNESKIEVTGGAHTDNLKDAPQIRRNLKDEFNIPDGKRHMLFVIPNTTGTPISEIAFALKAISEFCASNEFALIVKPHPATSGQEMQKIRESLTNSDVIYNSSKYSTQELICSCNAFASFTSSTIMDAICCGKPCFIFAWPVATDLDATVKDEYVIAKNVKDVKAALADFKLLINNDIPKTEIAARLLNGPNDGKAAERIANNIIKFLQVEGLVKL